MVKIAYRDWCNFNICYAFCSWKEKEYWDFKSDRLLGWLGELGYTHRYGPDIAHDGSDPQRASYRQVLLPFRLREAMARLNPNIPTAAREDALQRVLDLGVPAQSLPTGLFTSCWWVACRCSTN